ncbi:hypothetical protein K504DRAFT_461881 [Pleomassaria siparia CBS 279.74]|uniref:Uncharacterized protein n=1 Tax=Pleomassaria siparia CBS 279.74 TaxID=1314801 RepID=A0A6G1KLW1_9PLEO|nr:hypothetical protein K504DRAFT_461881 [Pleomassaria siparia CBS 279.74]
MDDLPLELLSMIIDQLWQDSPDAPDRGPRLTLPKAKSKDELLINLRSIRLVCKTFRNAAAGLFGETFFQVRWVGLSRKSLEELVTVSRLPHYVRYIHCLRISAVGFDHELDRSGEAMRILATACKNLATNLNSILFSLKCDERSRDCQNETRTLDIVRAALFQSNVQPSRLRIYTNKPLALALSTPQLDAFHAMSMANLTCLKLDFLNSTAVDKETHQALSQGTIAAFIAGMPALKRLSIYFASEIWYRVPLRMVLGEGKWPHLNMLRLCGFSCRENELSSFLVRHACTLATLELSDFKLRAGQWRSVFKPIQSELALESFRIRRIWDRDQVFAPSASIFHNFTGPELKSAKWDELAVRREEDGDLDLEPVELGETGMFISFPEDLLYDSDHVDDEDNVNPIPGFVGELLHPGLPRGDERGRERVEEESTSSSAGSEVSSVIGDRWNDGDTVVSLEISSVVEVEVADAKTEAEDVDLVVCPC